ncbi:MAG: CBS domain-containing protein [Anaerolineae bacterium]|nr:CBS domain-containing protein [Anaerolineae bacterium]
MLTGKRMTHPVITISPETSVADALRIMHERHIRRLPVVKNGKLVGIVSERTLLKASPSIATTLDVYEIKEALDKLKVESIMKREVITVTEDTPLEDVARLMAENKIGGIPVVKGDEVVGIITETDIFKVFLEVLGAHEAGIRVSAYIGQEPGTIAKLAKAIADIGGNIRSLGTFLGESSGNIEVTLKVCGVTKEQLAEAVTPNVVELIDIRGMKSTC